jgi:hypothetical protein
MTGPGKIGWFRVGGDGGLNCMGAVGGAYAGGGTLCGVDTDRKGRLKPGGIVNDLRMQAKGVAFSPGHRQANQTSAEFGHKIDGLRGNFFRGADQVSFVFAVFIVNKDNHFARKKVVKNFRYLAELYWHKLKD